MGTVSNYKPRVEGSVECEGEGVGGEGAAVPGEHPLRPATLDMEEWSYPRTLKLLNNLINLR